MPHISCERNTKCLEDCQIGNCQLKLSDELIKIRWPQVKGQEHSDRTFTGDDKFETAIALNELVSQYCTGCLACDRKRVLIKVEEVVKAMCHHPVIAICLQFIFKRSLCDICPPKIFEKNCVHRMAAVCVKCTSVSMAVLAAIYSSSPVGLQNESYGFILKCMNIPCPTLMLSCIMMQWVSRYSVGTAQAIVVAYFH